MDCRRTCRFPVPGPRAPRPHAFPASRRRAPFAIRHPTLLVQSCIFAFLPPQQQLFRRICASINSSVGAHGSVALSLTQAPIRPSSL